MMESLLKLENIKQDPMMSPMVVDKINDFVAQVLASKAEVTQTSTITSIPRFPRQNSLPAVTTPYTPRTPAKESYTLEDFQCKYCHRPFFSKRELSKHTESVHFNELYKQSFPCSICSMAYFASPRELAEHFERCHDDSTSDVDTVCNICNQKFIHSSLTASHKHIFHVPKSECHYCGKSFGVLFPLWNHLKEAHNSDPQSIKCNICHLEFSHPDEYTDHIKTKHPYCCCYCEVSTESPNQLKTHYEVAHQRSYCPDCFEVFDSPKKYIQHFFVMDMCHIPPDRLICYCCNLHFDNIKILYRHICLDTFACVVCGSKAISCQNYQDHLVAAHNVKVTYQVTDPGREAELQSSPPVIPILTQPRLVPTIKDKPRIPEFFRTNGSGGGGGANGGSITNGNTTANYIKELIETNQSLLNSRPLVPTPTIPTSPPTTDHMSTNDTSRPLIPVGAGSDPLLSVSDITSLLKLCSPADLMKFLQSRALTSTTTTMTTSDNTMVTRECSVESEGRLRSQEEDVPMTERSVLCRSGESSFSSVEEEEGGSTRGMAFGGNDDRGGSDGEYNTESRRDSLRLKYQQLSITSRKTRRSSKTHLNKILTKTKLEEMTDVAAAAAAAASAVVTTSSSTVISTNPPGSFQCQRCSKSFSTRSILSRHWASSHKCYICSAVVCDLKLLNEHMKSAHAEYND